MKQWIALMFRLLNKGTLFYTKRYFLLSVMEMDVGRWEQIGVKLEGKKTRWLLFWRDFNFHCEWRGVFECLRTFHIHFLLFFITAVLLVGYLDVSSLISTSVISVYHLLIALSLPLHLSIALFLSPNHLYRDLCQYPSSYLSNAILNLFLLISITLEI